MGIAGAVIVRLAVYTKSKNTKKYRKDIEYGSTWWDTAAEVAAASADENVKDSDHEK